MRSVRRRSRLGRIRFMAKLAPVLAFSAVAIAVVFGGRWPVAAAAGAAVLTTVVSVLVFRVDRRRRTDVAAARARVAADYAAEHARYAGEHRAFTEHLVALLDAASSRIGLLRHRIDWLEGELASAKLTQERAAIKPGNELVRLADNAEWIELWPDFAEAPTVVDLVAWDGRDEEVLLTPRENRSEDSQEERRSA
ncbi:MAG TPA: hypothetical protein VFR23_12975 [Jiangellaceae bacterium]|nr:hypothetical protein [Jiangellaceae bacterium]